MRHGIKTVVLTTAEESQAFLAKLQEQAAAARADAYASERAKPIKWLECCCCGEGVQGRDWWNRDAGYGLCDDCVPMCCGSIEVGQEHTSYGVAGIHFLIPQDERDNPPLVPNRGDPLYGLDERLRIEYDGYVYWKGHCIDHFSGESLEFNDTNKEYARFLIDRCEKLEGAGSEISMTTVIWQWKDD